MILKLNYIFVEILTIIIIIILYARCLDSMKIEEKQVLRNKVVEMFDHAFGSYMKYAYPADELMPLSCKGRYRNSEKSRGDLDDILGNFSLTLVDSLDTLALFGKLEEFETAVVNVIANVDFDRDVVVSVFEVNIRMIGGLLGGHVSAKYFKDKYNGKYFGWYKDELLAKAKDVGYRLLPAFNTTTGLPMPRINLKYGVTANLRNSEKERSTCTACAGTLILEFAALSRLTGDYVFETKARQVLDYIWDRRNRASDLVGNVLSLYNGDWLVKDATIGAGTDSYYEYLLKGYILLGDQEYLHRFNRHYESIMKYMNEKHGSIMQTVHMHMPHRTARNYMDALLAFWPGLQVLKGDLKEAIKMHEQLYQVVKKHKFLPEAFLSDYTVHWSNHPLRPEFLESTYFLYRATDDPYYLEIGKQIIEHMEQYSRVKCGYAAISDVKTVTHEDRIDSFVYAETFKYLYLLFEEPDNLEIQIDDFVFTTEAHLLPLSLINYNTGSSFNQTTAKFMKTLSDDKTCPSLKSLTRNQKIREWALNRDEETATNQVFTEYLTVSTSSLTNNEDGSLKLRAVNFMAGNPHHIDLLRLMGIRATTIKDGRIQLTHNSNEAHSVRDAENGIKFMSEMLVLSKQNSFFIKTDNVEEFQPITVLVLCRSTLKVVHAGPAQFGLSLNNEKNALFGQVVLSEPFDACGKILNPQEVYNKIVLVQRGNCMFTEKVENLEKYGALAVLVIDNVENTSFVNSTLFAMSGDGKHSVRTPSAFLFSNEGKEVVDILNTNNDILIYVGKNNMNSTSRAFYKYLDHQAEAASSKPNGKSYSREIFLKKSKKSVCKPGDFELYKFVFYYLNNF